MLVDYSISAHFWCFMKLKILLLFIIIFFMFYFYSFGSKDLFLNDENNSIAAIDSRNAFADVVVEIDNTPLNHVVDDVFLRGSYFTEALALHEKASHGDVSSQYRLSHVMELCAGIALYQEEILNSLSMLYQYEDVISNDDLNFVEQKIEACADFNPANLAMFLPVDMQNDLSYQVRVVHDAGFIPLVWVSKAAANGHEYALAEIMFHGPEALLRAGMGSPNIQNQYLELLSKGIPEAWLGVGACASAYNSSVQGLAIQTVTCEKSQNCEALTNYDGLKMRQFLTNSLANPQNQAHHEEVLSWLQMDYYQLLKEQSNNQDSFSEIKQQVSRKIGQPSFQVELLNSCICATGLC